MHIVASTDDLNMTCNVKLKFLKFFLFSKANARALTWAKNGVLMAPNLATVLQVVSPIALKLVGYTWEQKEYGVKI